MNFIHKNENENFSDTKTHVSELNNETNFENEKILEAIIFASTEPLSINYLKNSSLERDKMHESVSIIKDKLSQKHLPLIHNDSHIIPIIIGDPVLTKKVTDQLLNDFSIYVQPINYPTVPKGTERLRITVSPLHTQSDIDHLVESLDAIWKEMNIARAA